MTQPGQKMRILALLLAGGILGSCQEVPSAPPRFSSEMYSECEQIQRVWEPNYVRLAKRRLAQGQNLFLYYTPPSGGVTIFPGIYGANWEPTKTAQAAIDKYGAWAVSYPDTGCRNIPEDVRQHYAERYNRFALTLYTDQ